MTEPDPESAEAQTLFALVRERYGSRLTPDELDSVRAAVESLVATVRAIRAVRLRNADEPLPRFIPFRADA